MKTLDKVIETHEHCLRYVGCCDECPLQKECDGDNFDADALHYLKAFRDMEDELNDIRREYIEQMKNPSLTWDELRTMEGKPVWVEVDGNWCGKFWAFVEVANDSYLDFYQKGQEYPEDLWKRDIGKTWQAYRKERS